MFLDIRSKVIELKKGRGYEERGLLGLAFHPNFNHNGLFYIHYSVAGTQGPGALSESFKPEPCKIKTLNMKWTDRENQYDHIDTVEEWASLPNNKTKKIRTLLNLRRPFASHNGFNSLNFSPETKKLVLTTGDGGSAYDPFNLSQDDIEIAGKIIEIDINKNRFIDNPPIASRFDELPILLQKILTVIAKGIRNTSGISYQKINNNYIKYIGNVGQRMVESIFSFINYKPIEVTKIVQNYLENLTTKGLINFGWRGWEGEFPTLLTRSCSDNSDLIEYIIPYYNEAVTTSIERLQPLISYFHRDPRPDKFEGTALTGVIPYMGNEIPGLTGKILFTDLERKKEKPSKGALAYTDIRNSYGLNDFYIIEIDYDFEFNSTHFVGLGSNLNQTKIYLGVYGDTDKLNQGAIYKIQ